MRLLVADTPSHVLAAWDVEFPSHARVGDGHVWLSILGATCRGKIETNVRRQATNAAEDARQGRRYRHIVFGTDVTGSATLVAVQYAARDVRTTGMVRSRMDRSSHRDQFST